MMRQSFAQKIRPDHLDRLAQVYVRQSTMIQVRENTASTARQYDLAGRAATWDGPQSGSRLLIRIRGTRERRRLVAMGFSTLSPRSAWAGPGPS